MFHNIHAYIALTRSVVENWQILDPEGTFCGAGAAADRCRLVGVVEELLVEF